jgi:rubrerythrin
MFILELFGGYIMNIYESAMKFEKEGEQYYDALAENTDDKGLKSILKNLAKMERNHYEMIKTLESNDDNTLSNENILEETTSIFEELPKDPSFWDYRVSQAETYKKAIDAEKEALKFYLDASHKTEFGHEKKILLMLCDEEKRHVEILENILSHIRHAEDWVEHAEFTDKSDEY